MTTKSCFPPDFLAHLTTSKSGQVKPIDYTRGANHSMNQIESNQTKPNRIKSINRSNPNKSGNHCAFSEKADPLFVCLCVCLLFVCFSSGLCRKDCWKPIGCNKRWLMYTFFLFITQQRTAWLDPHFQKRFGVDRGFLISQCHGYFTVVPCIVEVDADGHLADVAVAATCSYGMLLLYHGMCACKR